MGFCVNHSSELFFFHPPTHLFKVIWAPHLQPLNNLPAPQPDRHATWSDHSWVEKEKKNTHKTNCPRRRYHFQRRTESCWITQTALFFFIVEKKKKRKTDGAHSWWGTWGDKITVNTRAILDLLPHPTAQEVCNRSRLPEAATAVQQRLPCKTQRGAANANWITPALRSHLFTFKIYLQLFLQRKKKEKEKRENCLLGFTVARIVFWPHKNTRLFQAKMLLWKCFIFPFCERLNAQGIFTSFSSPITFLHRTCAKRCWRSRKAWDGFIW